LPNGIQVNIKAIYDDPLGQLNTAVVNAVNGSVDNAVNDTESTALVVNAANDNR